MLKHTVLVLVVMVLLLVAVGAMALVGGKAGGSEGDIGVGPTQLLVNGMVEPNFA